MSVVHKLLSIYQQCREDGVDHVQAQHPGEGACGQHEGDCGAGQHVGASCTVMCGDDSDDPASAVCTELKCVSFGDMVSASWDILGDVDCRNNGEKKIISCCSIVFTFDQINAELYKCLYCMVVV